MHFIAISIASLCTFFQPIAMTAEGLDWSYSSPAKRLRNIGLDPPPIFKARDGREIGVSDGFFIIPEEFAAWKFDGLWLCILFPYIPYIFHYILHYIFHIFHIFHSSEIGATSGLWSHLCSVVYAGAAAEDLGGWTELLLHQGSRDVTWQRGTGVDSMRGWWGIIYDILLPYYQIL